MAGKFDSPMKAFGILAANPGLKIRCKVNGLTFVGRAGYFNLETQPRFLPEKVMHRYTSAATLQKMVDAGLVEETWDSVDYKEYGPVIPTGHHEARLKSLAKPVRHAHHVNETTSQGTPCPTQAA